MHCGTYWYASYSIGTRAPFLALKQSASDSDHSPASRVQRLRMTGVIPTPLRMLHSGHRKHLTFPAYNSMHVRIAWQRKYAGKGGCSSYNASSETINSRVMKNVVHI